MVDRDLLFDDSGQVDGDTAWGFNTALSFAVTANWDGGDGDDFLWGRFSPEGTVKMYGGNGDDTIYGGYNARDNTNRSTFAGQGGKDLIRTDIYKDARN